MCGNYSAPQCDSNNLHKILDLVVQGFSEKLANSVRSSLESIGISNLRCGVVERRFNESDSSKRVMELSRTPEIHGESERERERG